MRVRGLVFLFAALFLPVSATAEEWTDGEVSIGWVTAPPAEATVTYPFQASASATCDPKFPEEQERAWELLNATYVFTWEYAPDGEGTETTDNSSSTATVTYNTASSAANDKAVRVGVHVTGTLLDYGDDLTKDTEDDITYTIDESSGTLEATLTVRVWLVLDDDLWWFNGSDAQNYAEETTLTAVGATTGTFAWSVVVGTTKLDLSNGGAWGDAITTTDDNTIAVKSTGASGTNNDLTIKLTYQGTIEATITLDVRTPASATQSSLQDLPKQNGYETIIKYHVRDQFTESLPDSLECNEAFGAWTSEFPGETWPAATPTPSMTAGEYLADDIWATGGGTPTPLNPGQPGADTRVQSAPQTFRLGSQTSGQGVVIKQHTLRYYRGKGRHE